MMAPEHTRKRQYQPSNQTTLNSYFGRNAGSSHSPLSPPLPPEVQSSLISVGMRVRKSVPEGYKTHKTLGSSGFPFPSSAPSAAAPPSFAPLRPSLSSDRSRELLPFCGLHRTGGWAAQEMPSASAPAAMRTVQGHEEEEMPGLSLSQTTTRSTQSSFYGAPSSSSSGSASSKKRGYEDEVEEEMDAFFDEGDMSDAAVQQEPRAVRPMAMMKSSAPTKPQSQSVKIVDPDDWEEASFLVPMEIE